jgi:fibronectin-binding autotransporter adhesin
LTKSGAGTLVLSAANTYTGTTSLSAGTLEFDNDSALNNTVLAIAGGTIQAGGGTRTLSDNITTTGDFTIGGSTALTLNGSLNLGGGAPRTITVTNTAVTTINGSITEPWYSSFVKAGTGQLVLAGNNTFSGLASVTAGTLTLANSNALGATGNWGNVVASGATLELQGGITINEGGFNIDGTGVGGNGAIRNVSGNNSLGGQIVAGSSTTIASVAGTLTIPGVLNTGTAYHVYHHRLGQSRFQRPARRLEHFQQKRHRHHDFFRRVQQ